MTSGPVDQGTQASRSMTLARWHVLAAAGVFALTASLSSAACSRAPKSELERGAGVFARACASCHGLDGSGGLRPGFSVPVRDLRDAAFMSQLTDADLRAIIRGGKGQMPPFGALLEEDEVSTVIPFVRTLARAPRR